MENLLHNIECEIVRGPNGPIKPATAMNEALLGEDEIYSYLVYSVYEHDTLAGWHVEFKVSDHTEWNTLTRYDAIKAIVDKINEDVSAETKKYVLTYSQPPLEMLVKILEPLVNKLAEQQVRRWGLEFEDAAQICYLVMCTLYNKGYYIHKRLLERSYNNEVLHIIRKQRGAPQIVSFEDEMQNTDDLTLADTLVDEHAEEEIYEEFEKQGEQDEYKMLKDILVDDIGIRTYDQLVREYRTNTTSTWGRKRVNDLKKKYNGGR